MTDKEKAEALRELYDYLCGEPGKEAPEYIRMKEAMRAAISTLSSPLHGEPLTLEQLRQMDGQPVWVEDLRKSENSAWRLLYWDRGKYMVLLGKSADGYILEEYGKAWVAYQYQPASIDREAWEPCGACKSGKITVHVPAFRAMAVCNQNMDHEAFDLTLQLKFCPVCGRPMAPEAWAELEKRLRG